uniref:Adhesion G protein-coupled receptor G4b n=1 Tax=Esox lucius TaxID=8010 RepID=A0A3P8XI82_ESOLU
MVMGPSLLHHITFLHNKMENNQTEKILNTFVVSASVTNLTYFLSLTTEGKGGWNRNGCRLHNTSVDYTTCLCDHLTHFGVLLDISRTQIDKQNEGILTLITYLGCGVSSVFLGVTVLTYTAFEKIRRDYPSKILINLSLALLGLNMVFLVNSWLSSVGSYGLCVAVASVLHYFLLASFTWMGLEAVHMYFALIKVFNVYVPSYILKFCTLGWGIPLVICCLVLVLKRESYGSSLNSSCWIQDEVAFYVSVGGYILLVLLFNTAIFVVVLVQIRHMRVNHPVGNQSSLLLQDLKRVSSLTFLLGLTWTVAFFAWGPVKVPLLYVFCILNSLQGFFVFLFHCLMKENVRKQWRIHLCFGRFRLQDYSEWSQTATAAAKPRLYPPVRMPSVRSIKSSSTDSTSASSNSSQRQVSIRRPNLGEIT